MAVETLSSSSLIGDSIKNEQGEDLGTVKEIMIDLDSGSVAYMVMAAGGVLGMGDSYFAVPWQMVRVDTEEEHVVVDLDKETIDNAPGFVKDNWPDTSEVSRIEHY